jgi:antagonist of KipI
MVPREILPVYEDMISLRVLRAMPTPVFGKTIADDFFAEQYIIAEDSDRVSYVLNGPELSLPERTDIISMAVPQGAIQITSSGRPSIVASDHGTIRGFGRIGYVIQADLPKLAQASPGTRLSFVEITETDAVAIWRLQRETLIALA